MIFENRADAGRLLGQKIQKQLKGGLRNDQLIVLGLPRGGVVTAHEVARVLHAPLGLILVRKLRHQESPEFAIGAVAENDEAIYRESDVKNIDPAWLKLEEESAREIIDMRRDLYFENLKYLIKVTDKIVILVDDGIATGMTMRAAANNVMKRGAKRVLVASPVASSESVSELMQMGLELILLEEPSHFLSSVGAHYKHFEQVNDLEVRALLS